MRFTVVTFGSDGDTRPFAHLCRGLIDAGHAVRLFGDRSSLPIATALGVPAEALAGDVRTTLPIADPRQALQMRDVLGTWRNLVRLIADNTHSWIEAIAAQARDSDAILFSGVAMYAGLAAALELNKPRIGLWLLPITTTGEFPSPMMAPVRMPAWLNRLTYRGLHATLWRWYGRATDPARQKIFGGGPRGRIHLECPILYGISSQLIARPSDWPATHRLCGHWSLASTQWQAPATLLEFLAAGPPPIYIGFGSPSCFVRRKRLDLLIAAVAGRRAVFYPGWSRIDSSMLPGNFFVLGETPHTWLFPRCSVVIHHGGAGTTHSSARAGVPSIVLPFGADQFFWASRLTAAGVAPKHVRSSALTAATLASMLEYTQRDDVRQRARQLGAAMARENGIAAAVRHIEELMQSGQNGFDTAQRT